MVHIKVPATTANMGAGFDCIGMALKMYNELWAEETESGLSIEVRGRTNVPIPTGEDNLIYTTIKQFYNMVGKRMPGIRLIQNDNIPLTRGLGSSAACIVAGLFAGNLLCGAPFDKEELARLAAEIEGHPDNVVPAVLGGLVTAVLDDGAMKYVKISIPQDIVFSVFIPGFTLPTEQARGILPESYSRADAVYNASRTALMVASIMSGKWDNLGFATQDMFHQPYRKKIIPNMQELIDQSLAHDAKGAFLSGAGPTVIAIVERQQADRFNKKMRDYISLLSSKWDLIELDADMDGIQVIK